MHAATGEPVVHIIPERTNESAAASAVENVFAGVCAQYFITNSGASVSTPPRRVNTVLSR